MNNNEQKPNISNLFFFTASNKNKNKNSSFAHLKLSDYSCNSHFFSKPPSFSSNPFKNLKVSNSTSLSFFPNTFILPNTKSNCSVCNLPIYSLKYICCICKNCTLCHICEQYHNHPVIKIKNNTSLSSLNQVTSFLSAHQQFNSKKQSSFLDIFTFTKRSSLTLTINNNYFTIRPYKRTKVLLFLKNNSKYTIPTNSLCFVAKGIEDLNAKGLIINKELKRMANKPFQIEFEAITGNKKQYTIELGIYCKGKLEVECNNVRFNIEINEDIEEEELEVLFDKCMTIGLCNKRQKRMIKKLVDDGVIEIDKVDKTRVVLEKYKWDIEKAIFEIQQIN